MDAYAASENGLLKGLNFGSNSYVNLSEISNPSAAEPVDYLHWLTDEDGAATRLLCTCRDGRLRIYKIGAKSWNEYFHLKSGHGRVRGLCSLDENVIALCRESGDLIVLNTEGEEEVRNDFLDLRVPVWIRDIAFVSENVLATCTAYGQIRSYDTRCGQRRPVVDFQWFEDSSFTAMTNHEDDKIIAGDTRGRVGLFDLRAKVKLVHIFKGFNGGVTSLQCHETLPYVVSSSIDRFVRVHELETKKMLYKVYCKSRINHVILSKNGGCFPSALHADKNSPAADEVVDDSSDTYDSESVSTQSGDSDVIPFNNQTDHVSQ
ncbi:WD repeat-containing protein 74 [Trichinella spiralis]|uniref:WD repeat-containing protein 74 n=1 Tax=Trichinella spiralis TaxID=6334 RepID=UPI0001EFCD02|nr:WD repeat-containing protein 74 [Trichinella spiralis]